MAEPAVPHGVSSPLSKPHPDFTVCRVRPERWQVHRAVRLAMLLDTPLAYGSTFAREVAFEDEVWQERLRGNVTWLATRGDLPLGSVTLHAVPGRPDDEACLTAMWVAPHARGSGVADALVAVLLAHSSEVGLRRVTLDVADNNRRAEGFYARQGFVRTGRTGELPHVPGAREFEMERLLSGATASSR